MGYRYKMLPPEFWFNCSDFRDCVDKEITPVFGKDGIYLDRIEKKAWVENKGKAYLYRYCSVLYEFHLLDHTPLMPETAKAIRHLIKEGIADRNLKRLYQLDCEWKELQEVGRHAALTRIKFMKEIKKKYERRTNEAVTG